ncbi:MAG: class I SAM-dependent methyltransferase [Sedimentisphaerales bacterium]|nr:class I SAM-dependent methyltransferase [Sedimentisphaerales bacterium]
MNRQEEYNPTTCCNCGSEKYSMKANGAVPVIACRECGLMRRGFLPDIKHPSFTSYAGGNERFLQQRKDKEAAQLADFLKIMPQLDKYMPEKGRLLEIGCAMGTLLDRIRNLGWDVTGVEPEDGTYQIARDEYKLNIINSTFQDAGLEESSFDVVIMLHVIEHLFDPKTGLQQIAKLIRPGGFLVLETPRFDTIWFRLMKSKERSVIRGHYYYFTRKTIQDLAIQAGFEVVQLDSVGRTVTLDRLCFYAAKFINSEGITRFITRFSDKLHLNKVSVYINLHDMMRVYLRRVS